VSINPDTTTVRRSVVVEASIERAFNLFTRDIGAWWDSDKHLLGEPLAEMIFEPHVGGHIIDVAPTGRRTAGHRYGLRAARPCGLQLGHQPQLADRDRPGQSQ